MSAADPPQGRQRDGGEGGTEGCVRERQPDVGAQPEAGRVNAAAANPAPPGGNAAAQPQARGDDAGATGTDGGVSIGCARMTAATRPEAFRLLSSFLADDAHYRASAVQYGDGGPAALARALDVFLARPEIGFVWLACVREAAVGACVVCRAISTSRGGLVAKLDDVTVDARWQRRGVGTAMLAALVRHLRDEGVSRIDTACHRGNAGAWRFYERQGFRPLDEERIALLV